MLTKCRIEKILELVKKEYDYMDNKPIHIYIGGFKEWHVTFTDEFYDLCINKEIDDYDFSDFFYQYLSENFNFDLTWAEIDYQNTIDALALLHEIGHIHQSMNIKVDYDYIATLSGDYEDYRAEAEFMSEQERSIAYRKISYEYLADKFAVEMFNKYAVKILAILNGTSQKEIKSRLEEVKKRVA